MDQLNIFIDNKDNFKSKSAILRFKKDVKLNIKQLDKLDSTKYLNDGFNFTISKEQNNVKITILSQEEFNKIERRKMLKSRLKNAQYNRSNRPKQKLNSLKRSVPDDIFKAYYSIIKKYHFDIPAPDTVINNLDEHKLQVSMLMNTKEKISNDKDADNRVKKYFKLLGEFLGLEPIELPTQLSEQKNINELTNLDKNIVEVSDDDTEEEPILVNI